MVVFQGKGLLVKNFPNFYKSTMLPPNSSFRVGLKGLKRSSPGTRLVALWCKRYKSHSSLNFSVVLVFRNVGLLIRLRVSLNCKVGQLASSLNVGSLSSKYGKTYDFFLGRPSRAIRS